VFFVQWQDLVTAIAPDEARSVSPLVVFLAIEISSRPVTFLQQG
jgi:hypothetical protein